jgi:pilus assembly protein CpaB
LARLPSAGKSVAVVLALVLAGVATFAIFTYVRGIEQRAFEDAELVDVLVAQEVIPAGISAAAASEAGLIARDSRPRATVPEGAITALDQVDGLVTDESILTDEVIVRARWVDPSQASAALDIPEGFEALSVEVTVPPGVAGFVRAGDRVSLIATVQDPEAVALDGEEDGEDGEEPTEPTGAAQFRTEYLLQGIDVLAVGQRVITEEGEDGVQQAESQVLMTVALQPEDAERMVFAIENASLYFTLLPEGAEPQETPGRTLADLFE